MQSYATVILQLKHFCVHCLFSSFVQVSTPCPPAGRLQVCFGVFRNCAFEVQSDTRCGRRTGPPSEKLRPIPSRLAVIHSRI